ncbi:MAG: nucleotidyltransferase family protein [bacterium]|nr:nucleotidyltransferase family protein [bacterium]
MVTKENKLIVAVTRADLGEKTEINRFLDDDLDWAIVLDKAKANGISCIFYHYLKETNGSYIPKRVLKELEQEYYGNLTRNILMYKELEQVLKMLNKNNIKVILLKGIALAELVYKNLALRPMSDVDLLVKKEKLPQIDEKMRAFGYSTNEDYRSCLQRSTVDCFNSIEYHKDTVSVHFHWHLVNSTLPAFMYASKIDMEKIWNEAISVKVYGVGTLSLAPHHLLIHLSEHAGKPAHSFNKLIFLYDIAKTIKTYEKELNWELLINEARRFNLDRPLYYSLYLTSKLIGLDNIPGDVLDELRPKKLSYWERRFFAEFTLSRRGFFTSFRMTESEGLRMTGRGNFTGLSYFLHLAMCQGNLQKIRFVWQSFFPPSAVLALRYPSQRNRLEFHLKCRLNQSLAVFHSIAKIQR